MFNRVLKFGGSSVGTAVAILKAIDIILDPTRGKLPRVVVLSALKGVTNELIELAESYSKKADITPIKNRHLQVYRECNGNDINIENEILNEFLILEQILEVQKSQNRNSLNSKDQVISFGEIYSSIILTGLLKQKGVNVERVDARSLITTDDTYGNAQVIFDLTFKQIESKLTERDRIYIVTGFIASTKDGATTTLGRGGSDYTGALIAAGIKADILEIWTDVDGILTCDPRKVSKSKPIPELSYLEALELCHFGAKVVYPPTLLPAMKQQIPVKILNTFNPQAIGSLISTKSSKSGYMATGISSINSCSLVILQGSGMIGVVGIAERFFRALAKANANVILITQASSEHSICVAINHGNEELIKQEIQNEFNTEIERTLVEDPIIETGFSIISLIGERMRHQPGFAAKACGSFAKNGVNIVAIAQGSSELNMSFVIASTAQDKALNALHDEFFLAEFKTVNLILVGTGLVGKTLLKQIEAHRTQIRIEHGIDLRIIGLANSKQSIIRISDNSLTIEDLLKVPNEDYELDNFLDEVYKLNLPSTILIDCTASSVVAAKYYNFLDNNIAVVTPNKKAQSGSYEDFNKLRTLSKSRGVPFLYETSVGAGLPILGTISDLRKSGDVIIKIEAVLSGTLSYIFSSFDGTIPFSEVVAKAQQLGLTEPDPREDLCGMDVVRKLLILARECGCPLEEKDVSIVGLVPPECADAESVPAFYRCLSNYDSYFQGRREKAKKNGKKLCFSATLENNKAKAGLIEVDSLHPFYGLSGSDNIVVFTTERYFHRPLVVQGPGAGAEVTAAGVFADIMRIVTSP
jgi:bifunctional aspartokinase / homoserine dehydrogenase 1